MKNSAQRVALIVLFLALMILALLYAFMPKNVSAPVQQTQASKVITATFQCDQNKSVTATFMDSSVQLALSDGRSLTLPHAISADGARYANGDESFVFWNKGNGAFITENGTTTYNNCVTNQ